MRTKSVAGPRPAVFCAKIGISKVPTLVGVPEIVAVAELRPDAANPAGKVVTSIVNPVGVGSPEIETVKDEPTVAERTLPPVTLAVGALAAELMTRVRLAVDVSPPRVAEMVIA